MKPYPSLFVRLINGVLLIAMTYAIYVWRKDIELFHPKILWSSLLVFIAYTLSALSINALMRFPGKQTWLHILPTVGLSYGATFTIFAVLFMMISNSFVWFNALLTTIYFLIDYWWRSKKHIDMAFIPIGRAVVAEQIKEVNWLRLDEPKLPENPIQAVVADLYSPDLTALWQKFLAQCTLDNIAVYNIRQVEESLTGRVRIHHMYENDLGSLLPSPTYIMVKYLFDCVLIIFSLPLTLPIMLITAIVIRLESEGNVLFTQKRVGKGGKEFTIYKFRSMASNSEQNGAQLAQIGDSRITRVGQFIRKTRIDELPQFFNILKGDMSLIGPRPEQKAFVEQFEQSIPFYNYRHIVRPGLSGWAQVTQGYAGNEDETKVKVEHDFYYIKHLSFSLDVLILFKTIKTILTGFGAR